LNLTLRVLGIRPDGYHELRTTYQSLALHDTLTFTSCGAGLRIECADPSCPDNPSNLIWRAAARLWQETAGARPMPGVLVKVAKRIPAEAGLGGGSSDAASALRALALLWNRRLPLEAVRAIGASIGADVPFFFEGGTALGLERGDLLFALRDRPASWVVVAKPAFGVRTKDAYEWWDHGSAKQARSLESVGRDAELRNDLEPPVVARHPQIGRLLSRLRRAGASHAAMSGSGSAVFGLFDSERAARGARQSLESRTVSAIVTRTLNAAFERLSTPALAGRSRA
jgi:4-diphosphocytidyl-2-C-methyl-D-erythritol kinase